MYDTSNNSQLIHIIGIGGICMSGIALVMHNLGYNVQGSDLSHNNNIDRLNAVGIKVFLSHNAIHLKDVKYVVVSSAITQDNVELVAAIKNKIPVITRAEMLAELMRMRYSIAISGSHGKTTTTSLIACLFEYNKLMPTVITGGVINTHKTNAYVGEGKYLIAEADESDATFIKISKNIAVITNIDPEHMEFYENFDNLKKAFEEFMINIPFYGFCVVCIDHPIVEQLAKKIYNRKIITYGIDNDDANIKAFNLRIYPDHSIFNIRTKQINGQEVVIENITIPLVGKHNVLNSLAAIAIGVELDFGIRTLQEGFKNFKGVKRRFTLVGEYKGSKIIDDYAHHPVEILATIKTAKDVTVANKNGIVNNSEKENSDEAKIIAIFQPHRYSRLNALFDDFAKAFDDADLVFISDVFAAGEVASADNMDSKQLTDAINSHSSNNKKAEYIGSLDDVKRIIEKYAGINNIFLFMGAGDITYCVNKLPEKLGIKRV